MQGANAWAVKTDGNGDIEWEYEYTSPVLIASTFKKTVQLPDGSYLLSGSRTNTVTNGYDAWLVKLSNTGNFLWEKQYSYWDSTSHNYAEDMLLTRDGDIAITGYIIPVGLNLPNGNDAFILKVDTCGYLDSPNINASFAYSFATGNQITFTNQSQHYCKSLWHFGDGDSSYAKNPQHTYTDTGTYTIMLITYAGNSTDTTYQIINITTTGITPLSRGEGPGVRLYPNPANETITIEITTKKHQLQSITLYDITGKAISPLLWRGVGGEATLNINHLPQGIYFCHIVLTNGQTLTRKIIKQQ
jgi:PKD repeat protein